MKCIRWDQGFASMQYLGTSNSNKQSFEWLQLFSLRGCCWKPSPLGLLWSVLIPLVSLIFLFYGHPKARRNCYLYWASLRPWTSGCQISVWTMNRCITCWERIHIFQKHVYLSPFVPDLESFVFTDASTVGLGYILVQKSNVKGEVLWLIISCGSCSLTAAQSRYSIYDLELSAFVFACLKLNEYMAGGLFLTIFCDHKALQGMERQDLSTIISNRTMRVSLR